MTLSQTELPDKTYRIWCLAEGDTNSFVEKGKHGVFNRIDAKELALWKSTKDIALSPSKTLVERIRNQFPRPEITQFAEVLDPTNSVAEVWPDPPKPKHLHVIVRLPSDCAASRRPYAETRDLWPAVTIKATAQGDFGRQAAVERNGIFEHLGSEPDFVTDFRAKLRQRRWIESNTNPAVLLLKDELHEFDNYFQDAPTGVRQGDRVSSKNLLWHLSGAFLHHWEGDYVIKEDSVWWIFIELGWYFHSVLGSRERHAVCGEWPFKLIVSTESGQGPQDTYHYTPRSDFHVSVDGLVYLLVEVQSDENQGDRYRMLLQAACAARLGRMSYNDPFVVVALYIENSGRVTQYFLFQPDGANPRVSYVSCTQNWTQPSKLFTAIFEIYNLVSMIQSDRHELGSIQERIMSLSNDLEEFQAYPHVENDSW